MFIKLVLLILLQRELVRYAYINRGYFAIGGEYLVIPLIYVIYLIYDYKKEESKHNERNREEFNRESK